MKKNIIFLVLAICLLPVLVQAKKEGPKETLFARVTLHVSWDKRNENSGEIQTGTMNLSMSGILKLNREFSGKVNKGRFSPLLAYALQNATFNYNYHEDWSIIRPDNPPRCPNPQRSLYKTGSVSGDSGGAPMNLAIHYQKGLAEGPITPSSAVSDMLIDYYEFEVMVPVQKTEGKSKVLDSKTRQCKEIDQSAHLFDGQIEIFYKIGSGGKMSGSKSWSSQALSNSFSVKVSDLPDTFKKKPAVPKPGGKNDVHYSLTWDLDSAPVAQIEREVGGHWYDITGLDQKVLPTEEIRLRGLVAPRSLDTAAAKWEISNWSQVGPAKGFKEDIPIALTPKDLGKKELAIMFCGVGETEITYMTKAGGQEVSAKVKFKIIERPGGGKPPPTNK
jgi:hypothetical protein